MLTDAATVPRLTVAKKVAFSVCAIFVVLAGLEVSVRLYHAVRNVGSADVVREYLVQDREAGFVLKPGFVGGGIRINSAGFRGPEINRTKPDGTYRMVALGDSTTFGPRDRECAYPFLLPDLLARERVEVINAGVEGYRTDRALVHLQRDVLPLQPDVVLLLVGWNDLYQTDPSVEADQLSLRGAPLSELLALSDAAQTFRRVYFYDIRSRLARTGGTTPVQQSLVGYQPLGFAERLRALVVAARGAQAEVVVLTWPTILADSMTAEAVGKVHYPPYTNNLADIKLLYERYQATLRRVAAEEGVRVIDTAAAFNTRSDKSSLFVDTVHFTCEGQAILASTTAQGLQAMPGR